VRAILGALAVAVACAPPTPPAPVAPACQGPGLWTRLADVVDSGIAAGAAPGAVIAVSSRGVRYVHGTGQLGLGDTTRPGPGTVYDLASLTKVIALTTGLMFAVEESRISLEDPVSRHVAAFRGGPGIRSRFATCSRTAAGCRRIAGSGNSRRTDRRAGGGQRTPSIPSPASRSKSPISARSC
jgi:CubicO group peptidase (beta-lactamase class C family)